MDSLHRDPLDGDARDVLRLPFAIADLASGEAGLLERRVARSDFQHVPFGEPGGELDLLRLLGCLERIDPVQNWRARDAQTAADGAPDAAALGRLERGCANLEAI